MDEGVEEARYHDGSRTAKGLAGAGKPRAAP